MQETGRGGGASADKEREGSGFNALGSHIHHVRAPPHGTAGHPAPSRAWRCAAAPVPATQPHEAWALRLHGQAVAPCRESLQAPAPGRAGRFAGGPCGRQRIVSTFPELPYRPLLRTPAFGQDQHCQCRARRGARKPWLLPIAAESSARAPTAGHIWIGDLAGVGPAGELPARAGAWSAAKEGAVPHSVVCLRSSPSCRAAPGEPPCVPTPPRHPWRKPPCPARPRQHPLRGCSQSPSVTDPAA